MNRRYLLIALTLTATLTADAWSKKGHQTVASIAQAVISSETYKATIQLLDGDNIVYWASWADTVKDDPLYSHTRTWHYLNVEEGEDYEDRYINPAGDVVSGLQWCWAALTDEQALKSERQDALKLAVHLIGDLHQPLHVGRGVDSGGNGVRVTFKGTSTNLHSVWDYYIVEAAHPWSYYQWRENLLDGMVEEEMRPIMVGTVDDWVKEGVDVARDIYEFFPKDYAIGDDEVEMWTPTVEEQLLRGGLRLARWLDEAFGADDVGVADVKSDNDAGTTRYYNLQGIEVNAATTPGLYVIKDRSGCRLALIR